MRRLVLNLALDGTMRSGNNGGVRNDFATATFRVSNDF